MCCQVDLEVWRFAHTAQFDFGKIIQEISFVTFICIYVIVHFKRRTR